LLNPASTTGRAVFFTQEIVLSWDYRCNYNKDLAQFESQLQADWKLKRKKIFFKCSWKKGGDLAEGSSSWASSMEQELLQQLRQLGTCFKDGTTQQLLVGARTHTHTHTPLTLPLLILLIIKVQNPKPIFSTKLELHKARLNLLLEPSGVLLLSLFL
jgi:hypothetical protein